MNGNDENKIEAIIDVGGKPIMRREAVATGTIYLQEKTIYAIENNQISKGDVLEASTVAVIQAVKDTLGLFHIAILFQSKVAKWIGILKEEFKMYC